jgi:DNA-binding transcriptional ArsR family regulator
MLFVGEGSAPVTRRTSTAECPASLGRPCGCTKGSYLDLGINAGDLGAVRFAAHPVWETVASLCVLSHPHQHRLHGRLCERVSDPRYDLGLLVDLVASDLWFPVLLCPQPPGHGQSPEDALAAVAGTSTDLARRDLDTLRQLAPANRRWRETTAEQLVDDTSTALLGYWRHVLAPLWERITEITEADLARRSREVTSSGLAGALDNLHEDVSFHGGHVRIRLPGHHRRLTTAGAGLWFIPTVFRWPRVVVEIDTPMPLVGYPALGAGRLWESCPVLPESGLHEILGHSRAEILCRLGTASTTTRLARRLGLSPATVSAHLAAMTRAGLLQATRRGREVFYGRTTLGDTLASPAQLPPKKVRMSSLSTSGTSSDA